MLMNRKSNYLAFETYHERYFFSTEVQYYKNKTLGEVIEDRGYNKEDPNFKSRIDGFYIIDSTTRRELTKYEINSGRLKGVDNIQPECLIIIDLKLVNKHENYFEFVWGQSNNKFGLLDRKED